MKLKYYLRGIGIGVIVATLIMTISSVRHNNNLSEDVIIKEALKLGMVMPESTEEKDSLFTYPASRDKDSLTLRRIYFQLDDGTKEYLVTNLMSNQIDIEKFFDLYGLRWSVKSKYRELKNRLEIEAFNSIL